uniref:Uncharacterized protein n=1 Tax=Arion vulgaris TaxID=1028688 RepID=A0A0B7AHP6_9EUPU
MTEFLSGSVRFKKVGSFKISIIISIQVHRKTLQYFLEIALVNLRLSGGERATEEMLAMDMTDIEKTDRKHCKTSILLEPSGKGLELPEEESWRLI